ncbi:hypothetical protein GCM10008949_25530 [Deinococcus humi]|nr:hypothetical protein GCM10008949_25530 [Deinococcus humi]
MLLQSELVRERPERGKKSPHRSVAGVSELRSVERRGVTTTPGRRKSHNAQPATPILGTADHVTIGQPR